MTQTIIDDCKETLKGIESIENDVIQNRIYSTEALDKLDSTDDNLEAKLPSSPFKKAIVEFNSDPQNDIKIQESYNGIQLISSSAKNLYQPESSILDFISDYKDIVITQLAKSIKDAKEKAKKQSEIKYVKNLINQNAGYVYKILENHKRSKIVDNNYPKPSGTAFRKILNKNLLSNKFIDYLDLDNDHDLYTALHMFYSLVIGLEVDTDDTGSDAEYVDGPDTDECVDLMNSEPLRKLMTNPNPNHPDNTARKIAFNDLNRFIKKNWNSSPDI